MSFANHPNMRCQLQGARLLLVDDDPSFRRAVRRMLVVERTTVVEAADGEEAIHLIEEDETQLLDAVLTDLAMPRVSGSELIALLLECRPALPVAAMSGMDRLPLDVPAVPILRKPFGPEELIETVAPLVLKSQAARLQARQMRADAAESRSLAGRQRTIARKQQARSADLMKSLLQLRERQ
jgi:two-component system C4-dicarboxylate transport response regulator DctD